MNIINLTPHDVVIISDEKKIVFPSSGVARCTTCNVRQTDINGIPVFKTEMGSVYDLPKPQENTVFIVSRVVAEACKDRYDLIIPNDAVRNEKGVIIGCKSFATVAL